jgi:uncharacterized protein (TIGR03437 family)
MIRITARIFLCLPLAAGAFAQTPAFAPLLSLPTQKGSLGIASADFNGDGFPDLAVANTGANSVSIYLGSGGGKFSAAATINLPSTCTAAYLTAGKFTGASSPDLLTVCALGGVLVLPNTGSGTFGKPISTVLPAPAFVGNLMLGDVHPAIADFNGDGNLDLAVPTYGLDITTASAGWYLLLGKGNGTFQSATQLPFTGAISLSLAAGDFNGDGKPDLVVVASSMNNLGSPSLQFAAGNGDGTFQAPTILSMPPSIGSLALPVDINGDGKLDLVFAGGSLFTNLGNLLNLSGIAESDVTVFLGDGKGGFKMSFSAAEAVYMSGAALANILGTGNLDLVETMIQGDLLSSAAPTGMLEIRPGKGDGTFGNPIPLSFSSSIVPTDVAAADLNGDGRPDIAASSIPSAALSGLMITTDLPTLVGSVIGQLPIGNAQVLLNQTAAPTSPTLTGGTVANGATYVAGGLVPGSWAQVKGSNLATVKNYIWQAADFLGLGNNLPTKLQGTSVTVNNLPAALYYVDPAQVNFQVPSGVSGTASVQVTVNGVASNTVTGTSSSSSPGIFPVIVNGVNYAGGVFASDNKYIGDPSVSSAFRNAKPGDQIQLFATALTTAPAGVLVTQTGVSGVTVTIGTVTFPADFAALVAVGEFQINFTVPQQFASMPIGTYPISITVNGVSSPATINSLPPGQVVIPITH